MLTNKEVQANRRKSQKLLGAYLPNEIVESFKKKLTNDGLKYTDWLMINIEKYMKKK